MNSPMETSNSSSSSTPSLEDLTKLLKGKTDSQRLAGLLLFTKLCDKYDEQTILNVYAAVGSTFLHRLLLTGMGKGNCRQDNSNQQAYLRLSVIVLAAFARVPNIASTVEMKAKVPLFVEVMSKGSDPSITEECYEFLILVSTAHDDVVLDFCESGGMGILASQMPTLPDGSRMMQLGMKLVQLIVSRHPAEKVYVKYALELAEMIAVIAKQFAVLHSALKFEALHLLSSILSSSYSGALHAVLQSMACHDWSVSIRVGVIDVLQNRVVSVEKLQALVLAERVISIVGEEWLIGSVTLPGEQSSVPADRCTLLVLTASKVEIAVILNELAYLKYETSQSSRPNAATFPIKLRDLGVAFALVERIIKLISEGENEESTSTSMISETTLTKIIGILNETVGVVLDYLQDAKEHEQRKGDDLLASVRIVGSYLAEAPDACKEKVNELLGYMISVEGADEPSCFRSVCFLLPMLCQITMTTDGCTIFASTGAFKAVIECLASLINSRNCKNEDRSTIILACDTILNFILKREQLSILDNSSSIKLLQTLSHWTVDTSEPSIIMMASSICSTILDSTSEEALMRHPDFKRDDLIFLSQLIKRSLVDNTGSEADLHEIVTSGYSSWADRFPLIKEVIER